MNFKKTWKRANEGFTLVELIVVIAILAILAGIAVPAYSGYIKKANKAADMQVLAAVNTAFAAACLENNKDINEFNNREVRATVTSDGTISNVTHYFEDFKTYFDVASGKFKVVRELIFVKGVGFQDAGEGATVKLPFGGSVTLSATQKDLIMQSNLSNDLGGVLTQVDGVGGTVADLLNSVGEGVSEQVVGAFMADEDNLRKMITNLGYTVDENTPLVEQYIAAVDGFTDDYAKKQLADKYGADIDVNDDKYFDEYNNLVESTKTEAEKNLLVLGIAQSAVGQNASDVKAVINGGNLKENLVNSMMGENSAAGMGTTALIYAAFTGYANSNAATQGAKDAVANTSDPTAVFDYLDDPAALKAFQDYMNSPEGSTDLDASIEAMDILNKTSSDQDAVGGILTNGFANKEFVGAIENLLK